MNRCSFENGQRTSCVSIRFNDDQLERIGIYLEIHSSKPVTAIVERARDELAEIIRRDGLENEHAHSRKKRAVHLEGWILCSGTDQRDRAAFDMRKKRVLLRLVEPMNLVHEKNCLPS